MLRKPPNTKKSFLRKLFSKIFELKDKLDKPTKEQEKHIADWLPGFMRRDRYEQKISPTSYKRRKSKKKRENKARAVQAKINKTWK